MSEPTLSSVIAAKKLLNNEQGAFFAVTWSVLQRAAIIGAGLALAGERKNLIRYSLFAAVAVELALLWEVKRQIDRGDDLRD
jgi:hypothetical protein